MGNRVRSVRVVAVLGVVALLLLATGCSMRVYTRGTEGVGPHRDLTPGTTLAVLPDTEEELDRETIDQIESLLAGEGYTIAPPCEADFLVLAHYEMTSTSQNRSIEPLSGPSSGIRSVARHGPYDHTVHMRVVEARPYLQDGEVRLAWAGAAMVADAPTASPRFLRMALICAVDGFGDESGEVVMSRMRADDRRIREPQ